MDLGVTGLSGLFGSFRGMADNAFGSVLERVELFSADLQTEKRRCVQLLLLAAAAVFCAAAALIFVTGAVVVLTWQTAARDYVIVGFGALYTAGAGWAALRLRTALTEAKPFARTVAQLRADRDNLLPGG